MIKLLNRLLPSQSPGPDPARLAVDSEQRSLRPIPIDYLNLISPVAREVLGHRKSPLNPGRRDGAMLTVVIPFRDRYEHLEELAPALSAHLAQQAIDHEILVIEQEFGKPFNKGRMMNIGALLARGGSDYLCFHDVDTVPMGRTDYRYCDMPLRPFGKVNAEHDISWMINAEGQVYWHYFGGIIITPREAFERVNGFSDEFWHWGSEDDDFFMRFLFGGYVPLYDTAGEVRLIYHKRTIHRFFDGTYTESPELKRMLARLTKQNTRRYRRYRRKLMDNQSGLSTCPYRITGQREHLGCKIITVSV